MTAGLPYFSRAELACRGTGELRLDPRFADALVRLRERWGRPLIPTSVCRAPSHNAAVGGHPRSLHLTHNPAHPGAQGTMAADIAWRTWTPQQRLAFARAAWLDRWSVGLHDGFVHLDLRRALGLAPAVFLYSSHWTGFAVDEVTS